MSTQHLVEQSGAPVAASRSLEFTGERLVPGKVSEALFLEHQARYLFAGDYVLGKDVLDVACGAGIGTAYLSRAGARRCLGLDIDPKAIDYASSRYPECKFGVCDALRLHLDDESVDVVVSFETIEHIRDQKQFVAECWRVLRKDGLLICSTPNHQVYRWLGDNPFHLRELSLAEFRELFRTGFHQLKYYGQMPRIYLAFVARTIAIRCLDFLRLKDAITKFLRRVPAQPARYDRFDPSRSAETQAVRPLKSHPLVKPEYFVVVGQKLAR